MKASFISQYCIQGEKNMELTYQIGYDETISRWNVTAMGKEPFNSPKKSFEAEVNMEESYVQVVYPVREAFLKEERIQKAARFFTRPITYTSMRRRACAWRRREAIRSISIPAAESECG